MCVSFTWNGVSTDVIDEKVWQSPINIITIFRVINGRMDNLTNNYLLTSYSDCFHFNIHVFYMNRLIYV
jgi:hypothetical protein